jgi:hypothetical protein
MFWLNGRKYGAVSYPFTCKCINQKVSDPGQPLLATMLILNIYIFFLKSLQGNSQTKYQSKGPTLYLVFLVIVIAILAMFTL